MFAVLSKKFSFLIAIGLLAFSQLAYSGQVELGSGDITPAPLPTVTANGEGVASFILAETAGEAIPPSSFGGALPNVEITVDLERLGLKNDDIGQISGTLLDFFSVSYNVSDTTISFVQSQEIPAFGFATVSFSVVVLEDSTPAESLNGWIANIAATDAGTFVNSGTEKYTYTQEQLLAVDNTATVTADQSTTINVLDNDTTPSTPATTTIVATNDPNGGTVNLTAEGDLTYEAPLDATDTVVVTYQVEENDGDTATATASFFIEPAMDNPVVAEDETVTVEAGTIEAIGVLANDTVTDGTPVVSIVSGPTLGSAIVNANGEVEYTAPTGTSGTATIVYEVSDTDVGLNTPSETATATVTIDITLDLPVDAVDDTATVTPGTPEVIDVLDNDQPGDGSPTVTIVNDPESVATVNSDGTITVDVPEGTTGTVTVTYEVTDEDGDTDTATIIIGADSPVVAEDETVTVEAGTIEAIGVLANDTVTDGTPVVSIVSGPTLGSAIVNANGEVEYTAPTGTSGTATIVYEVSDTDVGLNTPSETATATVTIDITLDLPVDAVDDTATVTPGTPEVIDVLDNDQPGDGSPTVTIVDDPESVATDNPDGTITVDVPEGTTGTVTVTYEVTDEDGDTDTATIIIGADNPVIAEDDEAPVAAGLSTTIPVQGNDTALDGIDTVTITVAPTVGTATVNPDGTIDYQAPLDASDTVTFTYELTDENGDTDSAIVVIPVTEDSDGDGIPNEQELGNPDSPIDSDGDNTPDFLDTDSDDDGIPDTVEGVGDTPIDSDGDNTSDYIDTDSDDDGIPDTVEGVDLDSPVDSDGDNTPDYIDTDSDDDGIPDTVEGGDDLDSPVDSDGDNTPDYIDTDSDDDSVPDTVEAGGTPDTPEDTDGDNTPDFLQTDSDDDGIPDTVEAGETPATPDDTDGDNTPDFLQTDSDDDGIPDSVEAGDNPDSPVDTDGNNMPDFQDTDSDSDGIPDAVEAGDTPEVPVDTDGDNTPDFQETDSDDDGIPDTVEGGDTPDSLKDTDGDNTPDYLDTDADNDGIRDSVEAGDNPDSPSSLDDPDTVPNFLDTDSDDDGIPDSIEAGDNPDSPVDTDGDNTPDYLDLDSDNDSINDVDEAVLPDEDGNGMADVPNTGTNNPEDTDGDNIPDFQETDSDNDGIPDIIESPEGSPEADLDGDGVVDEPADTDGDSIPDVTDDAPNTFGDLPEIADKDGDQIPDVDDLDDDNDGIPDSVEDAGDTDVDGDGIPNSLDLDSDNDGIPDLQESGIPEEHLQQLDENGDGVIDPDNAFGDNGLAVDVELDDVGDAVDYDGDSVADEPVDTEGDSTPDFLDVDSDNDGISDLVEDGAGPSLDTDNNGMVDDTTDSDNDGIPDVIDTVNDPVNPGSMNGVVDTDEDGIPDFRDLDSDNDSINDVSEAGQPDEDGDGLVDTDPATFTPPTDSDGDNTPDFQETDSDNDGVSDIQESAEGNLVFDQDGDGVIDDTSDADSDGIPDFADGADDEFGDLATDNDGVLGSTEDDIQALIGSNVDVDNDGEIDPNFSELADVVALYNCPVGSSQQDCASPLATGTEPLKRQPVVLTVNKADDLGIVGDVCTDVQFVSVRTVQEDFIGLNVELGAGIVEVTNPATQYDIPDDAGYIYPYGLIEYQILCREDNMSGQSVPVRLIYTGVKDNVDLSDFVIRKFIPDFAEGDNEELKGQFATIGTESLTSIRTLSVTSQVEGITETVLEVTFLMTDDEVGDSLSESGFLIFDPIGPALPAQNEDIVVSKKASSTDVGLGDVVKYTVYVDNNSDDLLAQNVQIFDKIDKGLSIITSTMSVKLDGADQEISLSTQTTTGEYGIGSFDIDAGSQLVVTYFARVSAGATPGKYSNAAYVTSTSIPGNQRSNVAKAVINVAADPIFDHSTIVGKVFFDINGNGYPDQDEPGVAGARLGTVGGLLITTDKYGRYHLAGVDPGDRARFSNYSIKLDAASIPDDSQVLTENPRVVRITGGMMNRINFGISPTAEILTYAKAAPAPVAPEITVIPSAKAPQYKTEEKCMDDIVTESVPVDSLITMVHFKNARNDINPEIIKRVADVLAVYKDKPNARIHVVGHTDSDVIRYPVTKIYENNYVLSMARAEIVANYLRENLGLDKSILTTEGRGPDSPIATNDTEEGEAMNRRTEIYVRYDEYTQSVVKRCEQVQVEVTPRIKVETPALNRLTFNRSEANVVHDVTRFVISSNAFDANNQLVPKAANKIAALKDIIWGATHVELAILGSNNAQVTERMAAVDSLIMGRFQPIEQKKISLTPEVKEPLLEAKPEIVVPPPVVEENVSRLNYETKEPEFIEQEVTQIVLSDNAYNADDTLKEAAKVKLRKMYGIIWNAKAVKLVILGNDEVQAVTRLNNTESFLNQILDKESMSKLMIEPQVRGASTGHINTNQSTDSVAQLSGWKKIVALGVSLIIPTAHALDENSYGACISGICSDDMISIEVIKSDQAPFEKRVQATKVVQRGTSGQAEFYSTEIFSVNPRLAVIGPKTVYATRSGEAFAQPTQFYIDTNYADFIKNWTLKVYRDETRMHKKPIWQYKGDSFGRAVTWNGKTLDSTAINEGETLVYVLEVVGAHGAVDKTVERMITVHPAEDYQLESYTTSDENAWINEIRQRNDLERSNILIDGGQVTVRGSGLPQNGALTIDGMPVAVDSAGDAQITLHKAIGNFAIPVRLVVNGNAFNTAMNGSLADDYNFLTAIADITAGEGKASGTESWQEKIEKDRQYDGDLYVDGRLAFYYKGRIKGKYLLTAQADTEEQDIEDLFDNLDEKNAQSLLRRIDPDRYYPVYGDGSTTYDDTPSQGKLYVRLDWDRSNAAWGDFNTNLTGTELSGYNRTMYGAKLDYRSVPVTKFSESKYQATVFASEPTSAAGYTEFLGTGGSLYYLRHNDVVLGSEKITVEVRDEITDEVTNRETLILGRDYDFDAIQGRIILTRPLTDRVEDFSGPSIVDAQNLNPGNTVHLVAEYEYIPAGFDDGNVNAGVRGKAWVTDNIGIGATYINEENTASDYSKAGVDLTFKHSEGTYVRGEYAQTESGQLLGAFSSEDGGINFSELDKRDVDATAESDGGAIVLEARLDLEDVGAKSHGEVELFYKDKDAGYDTVLNPSSDRTVYGARVNKDVGEDLNLKFEAIQTDEEAFDVDNTVTNRTVAAQIDWELLEDQLKLGLEVRNDTAEDDNTLDSDVTYLGLRGDYKVMPNTGVYVKAQTVLDESNYENIQSNSADADQFSAGIVSRLAANLHGRLEGSMGDNGTGAKVGLNYSPLAGHDIYANYQLLEGRGKDSRQDLFTIGHRGAMSDRLTVYQEYRFDAAEQTQGTENDNLWGLTYQLSEGWHVGGSYQLSRVENKAVDQNNHGLFERDAATISLDYRDDTMKWGTRIEYRLDDKLGTTGADNDLKQHVLVSKLSYKLNDELTLLSRLDFADTDLRGSLGTKTVTVNGAEQAVEIDDDQARFTEFDIGVAYRPIDNDKLNALFMYTYLYDLDPQFQEVSGTDEKSHVVSLDALYEITNQLELGGKLALKKKSFLEDRNVADADWLDTEVSLAILRLRYHLVKNWDIMAEYRMLEEKISDSTRNGALVEVNRHIGEYMKAGVGYNFTDFSDNLVNEDYDAHGWFVNILGKY